MKKKILIIGPGMEIGGVERSLLGLLDSIDYEQYEVDLMLLSHCGEFMPLINSNVNLLPENQDFSLISWPISKLVKAGHFKMAAIRLYSKVHGDIRAKLTKTESLNITICKKIVSKSVPALQKKYDIALGFFAPHYYLADKVEAKVKIGWVHTDYSNITEKPDTKFMIPMWDSVDYIACVSEQVKRSFDTIYPSLDHKTIVIENILSPDFIRKQADLVSVDDEMPDDGNVKVLSVGRFCNAKAFDEAVIACSLLIEKGYKVKWYLIGYGPDEALIRNNIEKYHVQEYVIILGKKDNPYPYMKRCDIYAQPSRYEGKAVTVTEAQVLNKPVMITRYATSSSQVMEGVDGYICEMTPNGIAAGVEYLINHPEVCADLVANTKNTEYGNAGVMERIYSM